MDKVWEATMKLTEEVMEMRKAMEQMQGTMIEKNNMISYIENTKSTAFIISKIRTIYQENLQPVLLLQKQLKIQYCLVVEQVVEDNMTSYLKSKTSTKGTNEYLANKQSESSYSFDYKRTQQEVHHFSLHIGFKQ